MQLLNLDAPVFNGRMSGRRQAVALTDRRTPLLVPGRRRNRLDGSGHAHLVNIHLVVDALRRRRRRPRVALVAVRCHVIASLPVVAASFFATVELTFILTDQTTKFCY